MSYEYQPAGRIEISDIVGSKLPAEKTKAIIEDVIKDCNEDKDFLALPDFVWKKGKYDKLSA